MSSVFWPGNDTWPNWQKIIFRFFFVYLVLYIAPWTWIEFIPGGDYITKYYYQLMDWFVHTANDTVFHVRKELVPLNGSGDTSYGWAQLWLQLSLSVIAALVWSLFFNNRKNYNRLAYWFRIIVRYFVIINCFGYGIIKLFCLQMTFPSLSQLVTPLGDYLPMRLSWMFMGYSTHYQFFSGLMEVIAGIFLLFRRTSSFGTLMATGVFINVMMLNLSYDIPVKLFSMHLTLMCLVLLAFETKRMLAFFIQNREAAPGNIYSVYFEKKWMRITKLILKLAFIVMVTILPFWDNYQAYQDLHSKKEIPPVKEGFYNVDLFVQKGDTIPLSNSDSLRWKDIIFERGGSGSVNSQDTLFRQRYRRGYFSYKTDTTKQMISFSKSSFTSGPQVIGELRYRIPDSVTMVLEGKLKGDSVYILLKRDGRHFQLAERQFHWLSEYNR